MAMGVSAPRASGGWHEPLLVPAAGCAHPLLSGISGDDGYDGDERNCVICTRRYCQTKVRY